MAEQQSITAEELVGPVFPNSLGGLRDKHNTLAQWRQFRADAGFAWVTIRTFRRSVATILDGAGLSARRIADQLGQSKISTTLGLYMGRRAPAPGGGRRSRSDYGSARKTRVKHGVILEKID